MVSRETVPLEWVFRFGGPCCKNGPRRRASAGRLRVGNRPLDVSARVDARGMVSASHGKAHRRSAPSVPARAVVRLLCFRNVSRETFVLISTRRASGGEATRWQVRAARSASSRGWSPADVLAWEGARWAPPRGCSDCCAMGRSRLGASSRSAARCAPHADWRSGPAFAEVVGGIYSTVRGQLCIDARLLRALYWHYYTTGCSVIFDRLTGLGRHRPWHTFLSTT